MRKLDYPSREDIGAELYEGVYEAYLSQHASFCWLRESNDYMLYLEERYAKGAGWVGMDAWNKAMKGLRDSAGAAHWSAWVRFSGFQKLAYRDEAAYRAWEVEHPVEPVTVGQVIAALTTEYLV